MIFKQKQKTYTKSKLSSTQMAIKENQWIRQKVLNENCLDELENR